MIVSTLFGTIEHTKLEQTFRKPTDSLAAYDFLLRGLAHFRSYAEEANQRACAIIAIHELLNREVGANVQDCRRGLA